MNKPFLLALSALLQLACNAAVAADEFTPKEREAVASMVSRLESNCRKQMELESGTVDEPAVARWIVGMMKTVDYCSCSIKGLEARLTPAAWRGGPKALGELGKAAATECIVPAMKSTFPSFCAELRDEVNGSATENSPLGPEFCGCMQQSVDGITVENFAEFMERTTRDYQEFQRTRQRPSEGPSLIATMFSCGLDREKTAK